jgi:hypothetical protein
LGSRAFMYAQLKLPTPKNNTNGGPPRRVIALINTQRPLSRLRPAPWLWQYLWT